MKLRLLSILSFLMASVMASAQGSYSFKINEVYIADPEAETAEGYRDEYGDCTSWIEILNDSYTTRDIRSCFLTNNRQVLDKSLDAPQRMEMMSLIPKGDARTSLTAKQRITFFADGHVNRGTLHANFTLTPGVDNFIALYDGNGVRLLDSITIPASLKAGHSYARHLVLKDGEYVSEWVEVSGDEITPNSTNIVKNTSDDKVQEFKKNDPYGIAMTVISMAIVFVCLILLYVFFRVFGWALSYITKLSRATAIRKIHEQATKVVVMAIDGTETKGIEMENYAAVIALALHEYSGNMHDVESDVITIQREHTSWAEKSKVLTPEPFHMRNNKQ